MKQISKKSFSLFLITNFTLLFLVSVNTGGCSQNPESTNTADDLPLRLVKLPAGFNIDIYASGINGARSMSPGPAGILFVGSRSAGNVYAVVDRDNDFVADTLYLLASGLFSPNGVAYKDGSLFVAEINRVIRFPDIVNRLENPPDPEIVNDNFPDNTSHGWKFIRFGPDNKLYVPVGAPCNICEVSYDRYANIMRMDADGNNLETYAMGVRNTVGFDWHPVSGELWFTDNGRDWLGDDLPPDELNRAPEPGMHFGYPYCHGNGISDPDYGHKHACAEFTPPAMELGPHVAALGMRFYTGDMFPDSYKNQILIAEHGSWNRSTKIGYRITLVTLDGDQATSYSVFAEGWLNKESAWGRPVDIEQLSDGSLLVSDDRADAIYRITYSP